MRKQSPAFSTTCPGPPNHVPAWPACGSPNERDPMRTASERASPSQALSKNQALDNLQALDNCKPWTTTGLGQQQALDNVPIPGPPQTWASRRVAVDMPGPWSCHGYQADVACARVVPPRRSPPCSTCDLPAPPQNRPNLYSLTLGLVSSPWMISNPIAYPLGDTVVADVAETLL